MMRLPAGPQYDPGIFGLKMNNPSKLKPPSASASSVAKVPTTSKLQPGASIRTTGLTSDKVSTRTSAFEKLKALEREEKAGKEERPIQERRPSGAPVISRSSGSRNPSASSGAALRGSLPTALGRTGIPVLRGGKSVAALRLSAEHTTSARDDTFDSPSPNSSFLSEHVVTGAKLLVFAVTLRCS